MKKRVLSALLCVAMVATMLIGCGSNEAATEETKATESTEATEETVVVKLGIAPGSGQVLSAIAEDKGFYAEEGIEVENVVISSADEALASLVAGKVDVESTYGTYLPLQYVAAEENITIISGYMLTGAMAIVAQLGTEFNGAESFIGATLATAGGLGMHQITGPIMDAGGDPNTDVTWLNLGSAPDRIEAVRSGEAEYAILPTGYASVAEEAGLEVMAYSSDIFPEYSCCRTMANADWVAENPETVQKLIKCWIRALQVFKADREYAVSLTAEQLDLEEDYVAAYMLDEHFQLQVDPAYKIVKRAWDIDKQVGAFDTDDAVLDEHFNHELYKAALDECVEQYYDEDPTFYDECLTYYDENNVNITE